MPNYNISGMCLGYPCVDISPLQVSIQIRLNDYLSNSDNFAISDSNMMVILYEWYESVDTTLPLQNSNIYSLFFQDKARSW
jgi:hypothetical protein